MFILLDLSSFTVVNASKQPFSKNVLDLKFKFITFTYKEMF